MTQGFPSTSSYLVASYGKGCDTENFEEYVTLIQTANAYAQAHADALAYTPEDLDAYYTENQDTFDTVSYRSIPVSIDSEEVDENDVAIADLIASEAAAKDLTDTLSAGDEDLFIATAKEQAPEGSEATYEDPDASLMADRLSTSMSEEHTAWLFAPERAYGDVTYLPTGETGFEVVMFIDNAAKYDVDMANLRHIFFPIGDSADAAIIAEAKANADATLEQFLAGEQTAEAFTAIAQEKSPSEDSLMENVFSDHPQFGTWAFNGESQPGDSTVVESAIGYHVVYFVEHGSNYQDFRVESDMRTSETATWMEEQSATVTIVNNDLGMKFINT